MANFQMRHWFPFLFCFAILSAITAPAQLAVAVSSPKVTGNKAVVSLTMTNNFIEKIESARAAVFLLDEDGKMIGQSTRWVIGEKNVQHWSQKGETSFNFVIPTTKPFTTTNLTAKVNFTRLVLEGGKLSDLRNEVKIQNGTK